MRATFLAGFLSDLSDSLNEWTEAVLGVAERAAEYGYIAIALVVAGDGVFPAFPGEGVIVAGAVLASSDSLNLYLVILAGAAGAVVGDSAAYWIGRRGEGPIRRFVARFVGQERLDAAEGMVSRRGPVLVFVGRFLPGIRIGVNMSCGAGQMAYPRFLLFDSLGALVWSTQAALLGFFAGKAFADQLWVAFVVAGLVIVVVTAFIAIKERSDIRKHQELTAAAEAAKAAEDSGSPTRP